MKRRISTLATGLPVSAFTSSAAGASENALDTSPACALSGNLDCAQVMLTFDEAKQQYKERNSSNRFARVEASNLIDSTRIVVEAGKDADLTMKSLVGSCHANDEQGQA